MAHPCIIPAPISAHTVPHWLRRRMSSTDVMFRGLMWWLGQGGEYISIRVRVKTEAARSLVLRWGFNLFKAIGDLR